MTTREELHSLVNSLPEEALEAAYGALSHFRVWPPKLPPQVEELRQAYEKRFKEIQDTHAGEIGGVAIGGGSMEWPLAQSAPPLKSGYWSFDHEDGDTLVVETHRYKDGHELAIVERISIQDQRLVYGHEITGPQGKREQREIIFDIS
jgi:hypothetical protein